MQYFLSLNWRTAVVSGNIQTRRPYASHARAGRGTLADLENQIIHPTFNLWLCCFTILDKCKHCSGRAWASDNTQSECGTVIVHLSGVLTPWNYEYHVEVTAILHSRVLLPGYELTILDMELALSPNKPQLIVYFAPTILGIIFN